MTATVSTESTTPAASPSFWSRLRSRRDETASRPLWLIAIPGMALILAVVYVPTLTGTYYAFTDWDGLTKPRFTGLSNFRKIFTEGSERGGVMNTLKVTIAFTVFANVIGMGLALGLHRMLKSRNFLRALFFAPVVISPVAIGYLWKYLYQTDGPLNTALGWFGLDNLQHGWLGDPDTALWAIIVVMLWQSTGLVMTIYLAGLAGTPDTLYEAAAVDGASRVRQFWRITLPALTPSLTINLSLTVLQGLRVFDQVIALTNGGPANSTQTLGTKIYDAAFVRGQFGYSSALSVLLSSLLIMSVVLVVLGPRLWKRKA